MFNVVILNTKFLKLYFFKQYQQLVANYFFIINNCIWISFVNHFFQQIFTNETKYYM